MVLKIQDFIDIHQFQMLQDRLNEIYSFPSSIIDNDGNILTATAWQDICTKFHRQNKECEKECIKSDQYIADHLHEANPAVSYRCPHGLIDNATPIIISGVHYGNFFTGQFFLEPPDLNFFRAQAKKYGFDEAAYLEAVKKVPIWTQEQLNNYLFFIKGLIEVISAIGMKNLKEVETGRKIQESENKFRAILQTAMDGFWLADVQGKLLEVNEAYCRLSGYSEQELLVMHIPELEADESVDDTADHIRKIVAQGEDKFESRHRRKDGRIFDVEVSVQYRPTDGGRLVVFLRDITERKRIEQEMVAIAEIGRIVSSTINIDEVYEAFAAQVKKIITFDRIVISMINSAERTTRNVYIAGDVIPDRNTDDIYPLEGSGHSEMLWTKSTVLIQSEDFLEYRDRFPRLWPTFQAGFRSIMNVPLFSKGEIIGALLLRSHKYPAYTERDMRLAEKIGTQIAGTIVNAQYYSDLIKTEKSLRESEERYQSLFEQAGDGIFILDSNGKIISVNKSFAEMHGYTVEEMLSMGLARLDVEGTAPVPDRISRILRGETLSFEVEHYHRDGHIFPLSVTANLVSMSHEQMIIAIHHDLTERKRAEEEKRRCLEEAERLAAEAAVIAEIGRVIGETLDIEEVFMRLATETQKLILFDRLAVNLHRLQEENVKVAYVFGEKIPGRHVGDIFPMKGSTCEVLTRTRSGLLNFPQSDGGMNGHFRHHDAPVQMRMCSVLRVPLIYRDEVIGSLFWGSKTPDAYTERDLRLAEKIGAQVAGAIGSAKLYSERKQAEEERARLQEQLVQSQKMESVGRLAGGVAHDFNNILGVIIGHADMALEQISPSESIYADLNEILKAANRSADLTRQLLAFARKQVISPRVLDLNDTVAGMLKMLQRLIGEDIHLAWLPGVNLWPVKIDPSQIDQILANLSVNARDAIAGVGKVAIETGNVTLAKASCTDYPDFIPGEYVLLAVSDNGCGMDKEIKSKLFEPFFTTKKTGKGTGLGLAMVYGIVKQNGGFIDVCSEPNQGTTLKIYLPRHEEKTEQPQADEPPEVVMRGWETVMIVEDEKALLDLSKRILEKQGYRVLATGTPDEAIRLALQHTGELHLLMTDVVMPEMNGRDLAQKLLSVNPNLKCLFTSGYTADVIAQHGVLDENVHFIQKPFSRKDLAAKVRAVLDQK